MGYQDRRYDDRRPPDQGFWRRVMGEGDNFFSWAFRIFTVMGITVRIHVLFVIFIVAQLIHSSIKPDTISPTQAAIMLGCLFTMVLLHEFGHCIACRYVGGEADDVLLWPLGGLAMCRPPNTWKAHLITTIGGPLVNVLLLPILGIAVYAATQRWDAVAFNPINPRNGAGIAAINGGQLGSWLFWAHLTNFYLLAFNVLLPMYPMDGGRIMQALLWWRIGREKSLHIAATAGLVFAVSIGAAALVLNEMNLFGVALFAGLTCWQEKQNLKFMAETGPEYATAYAPVAPPHTARDEAKYKAALKDQQRRQSDEAEVDRILAKISAQGMESLSRSERKALERHTEQRRSGKG